jgi:hypothetical protein
MIRTADLELACKDALFVKRSLKHVELSSITRNSNILGTVNATHVYVLVALVGKLLQDRR